MPFPADHEINSSRKAKAYLPIARTSKDIQRFLRSERLKYVQERWN